MKELMQIRDAVIRALRQDGLTAMEAFPPERIRAYEACAVAVDVGTAESGVLGFCNYLGELYDSETGTVHEIYGKQLGAEILVDVRARRAEGCRLGCQQAAEVLLNKLPSGIRTEELAWEELRWEKETEMFVRRGRLRCQAVFVAQSDEDGETFLDFQLKGVLNS